MNTEKYLSPQEMQDAAGSVDSAIVSALGSEAATLYNPYEQTCPKPDYATSMYLSYGDTAHDMASGAEFDKNEFTDLRAPHWHNMRVAALIISADKRAMWVPGTILPGGKFAYLEEDMMENPYTHGNFTDVQQTELQKAYLTATSSASHEPGQTNAAESRHGLIIASQVSPAGIHQAVHNLDRGNFVGNTSAQGVNDIVVNGKTRRIRPEVKPLSAADSIAIRPEFQPTPEPPFGLVISGQQLLIAGTLAAARSRNRPVNLEQNFTAMAEKVSA